MSIDSISLAPKASVSKPVDSGASSLPDKAETSNSFANALKGQKKTMNEPESKEEIQAVPQQAGDSAAAGESATGADDQKQLLALLENYFPIASANNETSAVESELPLIDLERESDQDSDPAVVLPPEGSVNQTMSAKPEPAALAASRPLPEDSKLNFAQRSLTTNASGQKLAAAVEQNMQPSQKVNPQFEPEAATFKQSLTTLAGPESATPEVRAEPQMLPKPMDNRVESSVIAKPLSHPGWSKDLGEHIIWMNNKEISAAEIKLNPVHLGPISVRIDVNEENQTSILIAAQHPETKEALESSLPKLRDMLQGQQLNLVNVNVSQHSGSNQGRSPFQAFADLPGNLDQASENTPSDAPLNESSHLVSKGLLSLYA